MLLIPSRIVDLEELGKNFFFVFRVPQPDTIEDFLSLDLDQLQLDHLNWIKRHSAENSHPIVILDKLSNLVDIKDENSAGQMQNFNMMVIKARKKVVPCCLFIIREKVLILGLMVCQLGEKVRIWQQGRIRPFVFSPANHP